MLAPILVEELELGKSENVYLFRNGADGHISGQLVSFHMPKLWAKVAVWPMSPNVAKTSSIGFGQDCCAH